MSLRFLHPKIYYGKQDGKRTSRAVKYLTVCVLDPDGDLVTYLIQTGQATLNNCWACYHTRLYTVKQEGFEFAVVGCGVGSSFAVLIAEQLFASGCKILISVTSAGIINPAKNNPKFVLIDQTIRDEGTSYHYLPANEISHINPDLADSLLAYYRTTDLQIETGNSWTTDAPYRETQSAIDAVKRLNIVCVEMEAAALYAFAKAKSKDVICFAHLTNTMAQTEGDFEKGEEMGSLDTLALIHHTINAFTKNRTYHWNKIYATKQPNEVSWTQKIPATSLDFIHSFGLSKTAKIIDIGGGESKLVDCLLDEGYENITVLDISGNALDKAKKRLGDKAQKVNWIVTDITEFNPETSYDIWHDRATFHFLTTRDQISKYLDTARNHVNGYMTIGTFSTEGPTKCSGLDIKQYDEQTLTTELENGFDKLKCITEDHTTPFDTVQKFLFCSFKRQANRWHANLQKASGRWPITPCGRTK